MLFPNSPNLFSENILTNEPLTIVLQQYCTSYQINIDLQKEHFSFLPNFLENKENVQKKVYILINFQYVSHTFNNAFIFF